MARAIEKGATYLDKLCHRFYDEPKGRGKKTDYVCRLCGGPLETYYCEERLYLVKCADCGTLALVKTVNPEVSASVTLARPTLTPPNEWVSVEDGLPENYTDVLCWYEYFRYGDHNQMYQTCGIGYCINGQWGGEVSNGTKCKVLYWQPLPTPPYRRPLEGESDA